MNDFVDISDFFILPHLRKRWKKRWLHFTPKGEKRIKNIDDAIKGPMKIIREFPERGTLKVTDYRYEFVIDPVRKTIITLNAHKKQISINEYHKRRENSKWQQEDLNLTER